MFFVLCVTKKNLWLLFLTTYPFCLLFNLPSYLLFLLCSFLFVLNFLSSEHSFFFHPFIVSCLHYLPHCLSHFKPSIFLFPFLSWLFVLLQQKCLLSFSPFSVFRCVRQERISIRRSVRPSVRYACAKTAFPGCFWPR